MATLAQALLRDHAEHYHYFNTRAFTYAGNTYMNHNKLMGSYRGMDGLKTGYVYASGYNLAASAVRDGTRLIGVVFGGKTARSRNDAMEKLLDQSFTRISNVRVADLSVPKRKTSPSLAPVPARKPDIPAVAEVASLDGAFMPSAPALQFNAMGLVVEQGDTDIGEEGTVPAKNFIKAEFQPRPLNTTSMGSYPQKQAAAVETAGLSAAGNWAIQVGAYASHDAGMKALERVKDILPRLSSHAGRDAIAPLMTNRGMIYRARLSGLARNDAAQACRILKGNCLILSVE
jgi:D-alanyl-D-alanine carboxypeptidase